MPFGDRPKGGKALASHLKRRESRDTAQTANIVPIRSKQSFGVISATNLLLVRYDPKPGENPQEVKLTDWLDRPELGIAVAHFFAWWGPSKRQSTRLARAKLLRSFLKCLRETEAVGFPKVAAISAIRTETVETYVSWLNGTIHTVPRRLKPLKPGTKTHRLNALKEMVDFWATSEMFGADIRENLRLPRNSWPGSHLQINGTNVLDPISLALVRKAAITEIEADIERRECSVEGERRVVRRHQGKRVYQTLNDRLHYSCRALVPYIILIGIDTTFNAEGLLGLSWDEIRDHPIYGAERWQISVPKQRGTRNVGEKGTARHRRSFPTGLSAVESIVTLLKFLKRFTEATRAQVKPAHRKRVFIFHSERVGTFRSYQGTTLSEDNAWNRSLASFINDNGLPPFTLRTLRATGGDVVNQMTGDIKDQQTILGHATPGTTLKSYRSGPAKQRGEEALAAGVSWNQRYIETDGRADTRNGALSLGGNSATTPGFGCIDPFASPIAGQRFGKRCSAFGACPICPLASVNPNDPRAYARLIQFSEQLNDLRSRVDPARYLQSWAPQRERLDNYWLPRFSESGRSGASLLMPPFPDLE